MSEAPRSGPGKAWLYPELRSVCRLRQVAALEPEEMAAALGGATAVAAEEEDETWGDWHPAPGQRQGKP